jgi:dethiobiotin synthetase
LAANRAGLRTAAIKPVAAGCIDMGKGLRNDDALQLQAVSSHKLHYQQVNPVALEAAIAPHIAAQESGKTLSASRLVGFCCGLTLLPLDLIVIEGADGWRVPFNDRETQADVARQMNCPVKLVVGMRLGCLNHALLTAEVIRRDGLAIAGCVANIIETDMPRLEENIATLKRRFNEPCLGTVPRLQNLTPEQVGSYLHLPAVFETNQ